jgi:hypothetical protein
VLWSLVAGVVFVKSNKCVKHEKGSDPMKATLWVFSVRALSSFEDTFSQIPR